MATERKYKATIEIGGAVAASLKTSFAAVTGNTKQLGASIRGLNSQMKEIRTEMKKSGADTVKLGQELAALERKATSTKKVLEGYNKLGDLKIGEKLGTAAKRAGAGFLALGAAAGAAGAAIWKLGAGFGGFADEAAEASSNIGVNTNFLLGLRFAAEQTGASAELADKALMEMVKRIKDADEDGDKAGEALLKLGLNISKVQKLDAASQFATIAEAFSRMPESAEKTALAFELFGKAGRKLPNLLNLGKEGLNAKLQAAKDAGYLLSEADKAMGDEFDEAMGNFKLAAQGAANTVGRELLPVLTDLVRDIGGFIRDQGPQLRAWAQEFGGWLKSNAPTIGAQIRDLAGSLVQLGRDAVPVIENLGGFKVVVGALAAVAFAPLIASVVSLGASLLTALPAIVSITTGLWGMATAATSAMIPSIGTAATALWGMAAAGWAAIAPLLPAIGIGVAIVAGLTLLALGIKHVVENWNTYSAKIAEVWELTKAFGVGIYDSIAGAFDRVRTPISGFFDWIGSKFAWISSKIGNLGSMVGIGGGEPAQEPIAGARAAGGPVTGGKRYLVGENGPELFTPGASGSIVPNNRLGGSVDSRSYNITINAAQGMDERMIADLVMARLDGRQAALAGGALYD